MKMQDLKIIILLLIVCACRKDGATDVQSIYHSWEAKSFMSIESVAYPKTEGKKVLLTFNSSGNVGLNLEMNGCGSSFIISKPGQIKIDPFLCTLICCDSKFSEKLASMLPKVTTYEIAGNKLKLNVPQWGYIELQAAD